MEANVYVYFTTSACVFTRASARICVYLWFVLIYVGLKYFQHRSATYFIFLFHGICNVISMQVLNATKQYSWSHLRSAPPYYSNTSNKLNISKAYLHIKARLIYLYSILPHIFNGIWSHCKRVYGQGAIMPIHYGVIEWKHFPITGEFPSQWPVTRSFNVFFDLRPNKTVE